MCQSRAHKTNFVKNILIGEDKITKLSLSSSGLVRVGVQP